MFGDYAIFNAYSVINVIVDEFLQVDCVMKAYVLKEFGGPEGLELGDVLGPVSHVHGSMRVDILSVGLNRRDLDMCRGDLKVHLPHTPGLEIVGRVSDISASTGGAFVGDLIMAHLDRGGLAERALVRSDDCAVVPPGVSPMEAAAIPHSYGVAWVSLVRRARLVAGENLLVLGAGSGIGMAAVQIGKAVGAKVMACASSQERCDIALEFGADGVMDSRFEDPVAEARNLFGQADVVIDPVGGQLGARALRALRSEGRYLALGSASGGFAIFPSNVLQQRNIEVIGFNFSHYVASQPEVVQESMRALVHLMRQGRIRPRVDDVIPFDRAVEGLKRIARREVIGKLVVEIAA